MKILPSAVRTFVRTALARYARWRRPLTPPSGATLAEIDKLSKAVFTSGRKWLPMIGDPSKFAIKRDIANLPISLIGYTTPQALEGWRPTVIDTPRAETDMAMMHRLHSQPEPDDHELHLTVYGEVARETRRLAFLRGTPTEEENAKRLAEIDEKRAQFEREIDEERAKQREQAELWNAPPPEEGAIEVQVQHYFNAMTIDRPKPPTAEERAALKIAVHAAVHARINFLRGDKTVTAFAHRIGVRHSVVARWCKGTLTPTIENLVLIAKACGVSLCWLAGENELDESECFPERYGDDY